MRVALERSVVWADVEGELVLLLPDTGGYYALNGTGADLWRLLADGPAAPDDLVGALVDGYLVEPPLAAADVGRFLAELERNGLVTVER
ncbi:MAG TPA: PqqD family protein [Actinomycetes bacterium]